MPEGEKESGDGKVIGQLKGMESREKVFRALVAGRLEDESATDWGEDLVMGEGYRSLPGQEIWGLVSSGTRDGWLRGET